LGWHFNHQRILILPPLDFPRAAQEFYRLDKPLIQFRRLAQRSDADVSCRCVEQESVEIVAIACKTDIFCGVLKAIFIEIAPYNSLGARRMLAELAPVDSPSVRLMGHSRLGELCLRTGRGEEAYKHLKAALDVLPRIGDRHDYLFIHPLLVLACLQRGDPDEAEYWLRQAASDNAQRQEAFYRPDLGGRAEIALARGLTEVGLGLWRGAVERMHEADSTYGGDPWLDPWALQVQSAAVTAHAHAGRLELVGDSVDRLGRGLRTLLSGPVGPPVQLPVFGTVLHALGMAGLASGDAGAGASASADAGADSGASASASTSASPVRMIALAERLRVLRDFQPTMSADRARQAVGAAGNAARAAYADAVSEYTALERDELWEAARAVVSVTSGRG